MLVAVKSNCPVLEYAVDIATNKTSNPHEELRVEERLDLEESAALRAKYTYERRSYKGLVDRITRMVK